MDLKQLFVLFVPGGNLVCIVVFLVLFFLGCRFMAGDSRESSSRILRWLGNIVTWVFGVAS